VDASTNEWKASSHSSIVPALRDDVVGVNMSPAKLAASKYDIDDIRSLSDAMPLYNTD
jgi:hypothetical protein